MCAWLYARTGAAKRCCKAVLQSCGYRQATCWQVRRLQIPCASGHCSRCPDQACHQTRRHQGSLVLLLPFFAVQMLQARSDRELHE